MHRRLRCGTITIEEADRWSCRIGRPPHALWALEGLARGYATAFTSAARYRKPVKCSTYRAFRLLKVREIAPVSAIADALPQPLP